MAYKDYNETKKYSNEHYRKNKDRILARNKERNRALRMACLIHYGGNPPKCNCCGESTLEFLAIDHINGGGRKHTQEVGHGNTFLRWIINNNFPKMFQILCHNCNMAKGFYKTCPHKNVKPQ